MIEAIYCLDNFEKKPDSLIKRRLRSLKKEIEIVTRIPTP